MTYLTDKSANIRKTANLRRKLFPDLKSATNFASNKPKLFLRVSSPLTKYRSFIKLNSLLLIIS